MNCWSFFVASFEGLFHPATWYAKDMPRNIPIEHALFAQEPNFIAGGTQGFGNMPPCENAALSPDLPVAMQSWLRQYACALSLGALHPAPSYRFSALYRFSASHPLTALLIPQHTWELATMDGLSRPMQMCSQLWHPIKHRLQVLGCAD